MDLLSMAKDLISIYQDIQHRIAPGIEYEMQAFNQTWGSTALGFGGVGGAAMTTARTYVIFPASADVAYVYFADRFAYKTQTNARFWEDLKKHNMASVMESGRYMQ